MIGGIVMKKSLAETHPFLIQEWSDKNLPLTPAQITYGSNKRVWWKGACGHEWQVSPKSRTSGEKCPYCAGKRVLAGYNDLASLYPDLAMEWSPQNKELRPEDVTAGSHKKVWWKGGCGHEWQAVVKNRVQGAGCPYCSSNRLLPGFNDLAAKRPELAEEWSDKNLPLKPSDVMEFTNRKVWWRCRTCGNEWETLVSIRSGGSQCPYCSGLKLLTGFNDFAAMHPDLAAEWSPQNEDLKPDLINELSRRNVWWKCRTCGHEWQAVVYSRVNGSSCPICEGRAVKSGHNDLQTTDPELCQEWDYGLNRDLRPSMLQRTSLRMVWWKSSCGHSWRGKIADRVFRGQGCTKCDREFQSALPYLLILYYAGENCLQVKLSERRIIGVPLDVYFPELHSAIIFSRKEQYSQEGMKEELVKDYLCARNGIRLVRILDADYPETDQCTCIRQESESEEALEEALKAAFHIIGIHLDINLQRDRDIIYGCFQRWKQIRKTQL